MVTGLGNYQPIEAEDLLAQLSDSDEEINNLDDSFNILKAGMDTGELDEVRFIYESNDNGNNGGNGDEGNWLVAGSVGHYDPSLPGPSTDSVSSSEDSDSSKNSPGNSSNFSVSSSGEEETHAKCPRRPVKKWKNGSKFILKTIKCFDNSNVDIQAPYKLPVDAKEVEYILNSILMAACR